MDSTTGEGLHVTDILRRLDAAIDGLCPCGAPPRDGSAYCSYDCEPTHLSRDSDRSEAGEYGAQSTAMRWRPDLVTAHDDSGLVEIPQRPSDRTGYTGRHNARVFRRADRDDMWHLRLDDGHRYVGCDVELTYIRPGVFDMDCTTQILDAWQRLERELGNSRHIEPDLAHTHPLCTTCEAGPDDAQLTAAELRQIQAPGWWARVNAMLERMEEYRFSQWALADGGFDPRMAGTPFDNRHRDFSNHVTDRDNCPAVPTACTNDPGWAVGGTDGVTLQSAVEGAERDAAQATRVRALIPVWCRDFPERQAAQRRQQMMLDMYFAGRVLPETKLCDLVRITSV